MPHCRITNYTYTDSEEDTKHHQKLLADAARGALPVSVREAMKDAGWAVVTNGQMLRPNAEAAKLMICFAYWARSKQQGIPDEHFEQFMLDRLYFVENKHDVPEVAQARIAKWTQYEI